MTDQQPTSEVTQATEVQPPSFAFSKNGLPLSLTIYEKYSAAIKVFAVSLTVYALTNRFQITKPNLLPLSVTDLAAPDWANLIWVYASALPLVIMAIVTCKDLQNLGRYLYAQLAMTVFCGILFFVWPTLYPRADYPPPADLNALSYFLYQTVEFLDEPTTACPSFLVASAFLACLIFLNEQRLKFPVFLAWAVAVAASSVITRQNATISVVAGIFTAVIFHWTFHQIVAYRLPDDGTAEGAQAKR